MEAPRSNISVVDESLRDLGWKLGLRMPATCIDALPSIEATSGALWLTAPELFRQIRFGGFEEAPHAFRCSLDLVQRGAVQGRQKNFLRFDSYSPVS
jgi:hypothetical protein